MLYPEFDELISYKNLKFKFGHSLQRPSQAHIVGGQHSPFRGQGLEFDSVRKYVPGDDIRNIDWRVTARTGAPHLKIFQEERQRHIILCIDMNVGMRFGTRGTFKSIQAAHIAALLGWQAINHQDRVSACLFGDVPGSMEFFNTKNSTSSFLQVLKRLSQTPSENHSVSFAEVFRHVNQAAHTGSLIYVVSDFLDLGEDKELELFLSNIRQRSDVVFISVNDPADQTLIPLGMIEACSGHHEKLLINTDSLKGIESYASQWKENRKNLYQKTTRFGIPLIELTTQTDIKKDLWIALKSLIKRRSK